MAAYHEDTYLNQERDFVIRKIRKMDGAHEENFRKIGDNYECIVKITFRATKYETGLVNNKKELMSRETGSSKKEASKRAWIQIGNDLSDYLNPKAPRPQPSFPRARPSGDMPESELF